MNSTLGWILPAAMILFPTLPFPAILVAYNRMLQHKLEKISRTIRGEHFREFTQYFKTTITDSPPASFERLETSSNPPHAFSSSTIKYAPKEDTIKQHFYMFYHWHIYAFPIGITVTVVALAMLILLTREDILPQGESKAARFFTAFPTSLFFGVLGAYLWGLYDMLVRYRSMDLTPSSIHFIWLRILIAGALGYIVSLGLKPEMAIAAAFGIGVFPLHTLQRLVTERTQRSLSFDTQDQPVEKTEIHKLQGASRSVINRLGEEGIDSVEHLAFADPVNLLLRTSIEWKVLLDLIDQAALFAYIGDKIDLLRLCGIRGAMEALTIGEILDRSVPMQTSTCMTDIDELLNTLSNRLGVEKCMLRRMFISISADLHVQFICALWAAQHEEYTLPAEQ